MTKPKPIIHYAWLRGETELYVACGMEPKPDDVVSRRPASVTCSACQLSPVFTTARNALHSTIQGPQAFKALDSIKRREEGVMQGRPGNRIPARIPEGSMVGQSCRFGDLMPKPHSWGVRVDSTHYYGSTKAIAAAREKLRPFTREWEQWRRDFISCVKLTPGRHDTPADGLCLMEACALYAGEPHTDMPNAVCAAVGAFARPLNDVFTQNKGPLTPRLRHHIDTMINTASLGHHSMQRQREQAIDDWIQHCFDSFIGEPRPKGDNADILLACLEDELSWVIEYMVDRGGAVPVHQFFETLLYI